MGGRAAPGSRAGRRLVAGLLLVASLAGCGGGDDGPDDGTAAPPVEPGGDDPDEATSGTLELAPASTTTTTPADRAVAELLLEELPLPSFQRADDVLAAGPLDLEAAAAGELDVEAERSLLEARGFERGASRAWLGPAQDVVYLAIYDFADADGAAAYLRAGADTLLDRGATPFEVPEVDGAVGFTTVEEGPDGTFTAHAVAFARGDRWALTLVGSPSSARSPEDARAVAAEQADRLG